MSIIGTYKLVQKSVVDLEHYNLNKYLFLSFLITLITSLLICYLGYVFFLEFLFNISNLKSDNSYISTILNSYYFYILIITLKILFGFTLFAIILVPIGCISTAFFADNIFDEINLKNKKKYKYKRRKNYLYLSLKFSVLSATRTLFFNLLIFPLYFFIPIANIIIFVIVNGFFISREMAGNFLVQFHDKNYLKYFFTIKSGELYSIGCVIAFLYTVPIINLFTPFVASVVFANVVLDYKDK